MVQWLNLGEKLEVNADKFPDKVAVKDDMRTLTFRQYNERACRLAHGLLSLGLKDDDRVAVVSQNRVEWMEIYAACAKAGLVTVPLNWRLSAQDMTAILDDSGAKVVIVHETFVQEIEGIRRGLRKVGHYVFIGPKDKMPWGWSHYEDVVDKGRPEEPKVKVDPEETWIQLYTSGTTGRPKGVLRSHRSYVAFFLINAIEFQLHRDDIGMVVMPMCHVNSTFHSFVFTYIGASVYVYPEYNFKPEQMLEAIDREKVTFISLVPTHYALVLSVPKDVVDRFQGKSMRTLLCSSAPVLPQTKKDIMKFFPKAKLFEAYGSTEAGLVTLLRPEEQLTKIGSVGKECVGSDTIRILDDKKRPVPEGEVGEIYSRSPMQFSGYHHLPAKSREAFTEDGYFSAGDMGRRDKDGYYYIVDRKDNMIITGGEHVFPTEVEEVLSKHPAIAEVAVIGTLDEKWGEMVTAVVVLKDGAEATEEAIIDSTKDVLPAFKRPKKVIFIKADEVPRTATGKVLHRELKARFSIMPRLSRRK